MAKKNASVDDVLAVVHTGLEGDEATAFRGYLAAELGALKAEGGEDVFSLFKLTGKGDKAKGVYAGPRIEFKGHNTAKIVVHFAALAMNEASKLGIIPPIVDCRTYCEAWAARRRASKPVGETVTA